MNKVIEDGGVVNKSIKREWVLILAIVAVALSLRPGIVSIGPILPLIIDEFNLSHTSASLLTSIPDLLMGLLALPTPWLARKFGRDPLLLAALIVLSGAIVVRAFSPNANILLLSTAGVGAGIAISGALFGGLIKARFPNHVAVMMGLYSTAISLGSAISAAASGSIALRFEDGWREASGVWGVLGLVSIIAWSFAMRSERSGAMQVAKAPSVPAKLPLTNKTAWLIAGFFAAINFLFYSIISWLAPMYQELGRSSADAGYILATFMVVFLFASPFVGMFSKSTDRRRWLAFCTLFVIVGLAGIAVIPDTAPILWVALCAFGLGGAFTLGMTLPLDHTHHADETNAWNAFVLTIGYLIAAGGPLMVGGLRDVTGHFEASFYLLVVVAIVMLLITPFLKPKLMRSQS